MIDLELWPRIGLVVRGSSAAGAAEQRQVGSGAAGSQRRR
jgi:hypothetical protein